MIEAVRFCHYCGDRAACVAWPSPDRRLSVWACSDRVACTARVRVLAAHRASVTSGAA